MNGKFLHDDRGSTMIEMTLIFVLFMILTFGVIEGGYLFWQWNSAENATQMGARIAVISDPVDPEISSWSCADTSLKSGAFCNTSTQRYPTVTCSATSTTSGTCSGGLSPSFSPTAFNTILARMRSVFPNIQAQNVVVEYRDIGLGFAGRGTPVNAVTVSLTGMTYKFFALGPLLGLNSIALPAFPATLTSEALDSSGVS